jgi:hypothetical protein
MLKESFSELCECICNIVREEVFCPKGLPQLVATNHYHGGFISGELKLAIAIQMMAGASYVDLIFGFLISQSTLYREFDNIITWINESFQFSLAGFIKNKDEEKLIDISNDFAEFSCGVFNGIIGAPDGIAIRINCPSAADGVPDPGNYWTRKQFYALNVQAICDSKKQFLWVSTGHQGTTHDSLAFDVTNLNRNLLLEVVWFRSKGFFWLVIQHITFLLIS